MSIKASRRLKPIDQQVILITGASSGIGLVTAKAAASRGAKVVLVARDADALEHIAREIAANGGSALAVSADVGILDDVQEAGRRAVEHFGRIDTWVNNAGVAIYAKLIDTPMDEHEMLFRTNYFGAVHGALTAIPLLRDQGGAIITVGSIACDIPSPVMGAYSASKHAVKGFIHSLRIEVMADDLPISITLIKPSGIDTPIAQHAANHVEGEALIPPPVYDPLLVATAILDAAEHPHRDVTVGGAGKLQTLLVEHFPQGLDYLGRLFEGVLSDKSKSKTQLDNLAHPVGNGEPRSPDQRGRSFSVFTAAARHPLSIGLAFGVVATAMLIGRNVRLADAKTEA